MDLDQVVIWYASASPSTAGDSLGIIAENFVDPFAYVTIRK